MVISGEHVATQFKKSGLFDEDLSIVRTSYIFTFCSDLARGEQVWYYISDPNIIHESIHSCLWTKQQCESNFASKFFLKSRVLEHRIAIEQKC